MAKIGYKELKNRNVFDSEIITIALIAVKYFHGNIDHAIDFFKSTNLMSGMLRKSRFNRRIHLIFKLIIDLFAHIAAIIKRLNISSEYIIDSFPVVVCENINLMNARKSNSKQPQNNGKTI